MKVEYIYSFNVSIKNNDPRVWMEGRPSDMEDSCKYIE
jgi:hypothetical protein